MTSMQSLTWHQIRARRDVAFMNSLRAVPMYRSVQRGIALQNLYAILGSVFGSRTNRIDQNLHLDACRDLFMLENCHP